MSEKMQFPSLDATVRRWGAHHFETSDDYCEILIFNLCGKKLSDLLSAAGKKRLIVASDNKAIRNLIGRINPTYYFTSSYLSRHPGRPTKEHAIKDALNIVRHSARATDVLVAVHESDVGLIHYVRNNLHVLNQRFITMDDVNRWRLG